MDRYEPLRRRTIALVGLMGVGKSSVGRRLATAIGLPFRDADAEVEAAAGRTIPEIFAALGEPAFRDGEPLMRLLLINPNTNAGTTSMMRGIAQATASAGTVIDAMSAPYGVPLITNEEALAQSAKAVQALTGAITTAPPDGVIIAAFGDPGLAALRLRLSCP
eukprot:gene55082-75476_t